MDVYQVVKMWTTLTPERLSTKASTNQKCTFLLSETWLPIFNMFKIVRVKNVRVCDSSRLLYKNLQRHLEQVDQSASDTFSIGTLLCLLMNEISSEARILWDVVEQLGCHGRFNDWDSSHNSWVCTRLCYSCVKLYATEV